MTSEGDIQIQYWEEGVQACGSFIDIRVDHLIYVGRFKNNKNEEGFTRRGRVYYPDGTFEEMED